MLRDQLGWPVVVSSALGIAGALAKLYAGFLIDYIWAPALACCTLMLPAILMLILQMPERRYGIRFTCLPGFKIF